jgi:ABC-type Fe3+ transport system permease subunit
VTSDRAPLRRLGSIDRGIVVFTVVATLANVASTAFSLAAVDEARDFLDGAIPEQEFEDAFAPALSMAVVQLFASIVTAVLTILWLYRILKNHQALGRADTWRPGWAIGSWFLPPGLLYVLPFLVLREAWKGSDPDVPVGDPRWKQSPVTAALLAWWVLFGLAPLVLFAIRGAAAITGAGSQDARDAADALRDTIGVSVASTVIAVGAGVAWIVVVRGLSSRHRELLDRAAGTR